MVFNIILVALGDLMGAKGGATAGAMRGNLVALIYQTFIPHLLYCPPDTLYVSAVHSDVRMFQVYPEANPLSQGIIFPQVVQNTIPTALIESFNTVFLNLRLTGKAELLFHLQFHR